MSVATRVDYDVPEGWYSDPQNPRMQRYWGGSDWSDYVRYADAASMPKVKFDTAPDFESESRVASLSDHQAVLAYLTQPHPAAEPAFATPEAVASSHEFEAPIAVAAPAALDPSFAFDIPAAFTALATSTSPVAFTAPAVAHTAFAQESYAAPPMTLTKRDFAAQPAFAPAFASDGQGIAYVPMRSYYLPPSARAGSWNPRAFSPSNPAIWLLALSPIIWTALQFFTNLLAPAANAPMISVAVSGAMFVLMLICALADRSDLKRRSMAAPSIAWFFGGVVPYFTARWFVLRREGTRYVAPAVTFILLLIASATLWVTLLGPTALL